MSHDAYVGNAADLKQVQDAERRERRISSTEHDLLGAQLDSYSGRRFVWELLEDHDVFAEPRRWDQAAIYEFLGKRSWGIALYRKLWKQFPKAFLQMQQEAQARATRDTHERQAAHTPRASEERPDA